MPDSQELPACSRSAARCKRPTASSGHSHTDGTEEATMHPAINLEFANARTADLNRKAEPHYLIQAARQARRARCGLRTTTGRTASTLARRSLRRPS
jgi:hypothetical protein